MKNYISHILLIVSISTIPVIHLIKLPNEKFYEHLAAVKLFGIEQVKLKNNEICDILTDTFSIEVDFVTKWYESIGQCESYSIQSQKKPGIVLIIKNVKDYRILNNAIEVCKKLNINLWIIESYNLTLKRILSY